MATLQTGAEAALQRLSRCAWNKRPSGGNRVRSSIYNPRVMQLLATVEADGQADARALSLLDYPQLVATISGRVCKGFRRRTRIKICAGRMG